MCYAIVGIPLGLVMFQSIGERVNKLSSVVIRNVKRLLRCKDVEASEINLICVVTTLSSLTIAGGAAAFSRYEGKKRMEKPYLNLSLFYSSTFAFFVRDWTDRLSFVHVANGRELFN